MDPDYFAAAGKNYHFGFVKIGCKSSSEKDISCEKIMN